MVSKVSSLTIARLDAGGVTRDSFIMIVSGFLSGFFAYLYQFSMGILLPPAEYGLLLSLTSILVIVMVFCQGTTMAVARFVSKSKAGGSLGGVHFLWWFFLKRSLPVSIITFVLFCALNPLLSKFLAIDNGVYPLILYSSLLVVLVLSVNQGVLQGLQSFVVFGLSRALTGLFKMVLGAILVYLGFGIAGGLAAIPISFALVLPITFIPLRQLSRAGKETVSVAGLHSYIGLATVATLAITMLTNVDVILARHYLGAVDAGNYSIISVLGRVAFYAPAGIALAMFPKTSETFENGGNHRRLLIKGTLLNLLITGAIALVFGLFPQSVNDLLLGNKYPLATPYFLEYGLAMGLFSFSFLLMNYFLSLGQTKVAYPISAVALVQLVLIGGFHSDIAKLVDIVLITGVISVVSLFPFFLKKKK